MTVTALIGFRIKIQILLMATVSGARILLACRGRAV